MDSQKLSPLRRQAADALRRARRLPVGHARNDLRQLAIGLLWLEKRGFVATIEGGEVALQKMKAPPDTPSNEIAMPKFFISFRNGDKIMKDPGRH
jgi:hypothetical protein